MQSQKVYQGKQLGIMLRSDPNPVSRGRQQADTREQDETDEDQDSRR